MTAQAQQGAVLLGRTLNRTYYVERLLGGGGMGAVYAARHVRTGGLFAVKVLHRETATDSEIYKRFQDEARIVSGLRHPHIVQVTDFDCDEDGTPFIVMELLEGEDLYQRLCRVRRLSLPEVLDIARQVGSALHAAHEKGIVHRDVKPQNIFLVRHEIAEVVEEVAKVVDFGISKIRRSDGQMTRDLTLLGTPQFMSPEAAVGQNSALDGRADQWSLAVIAYLCLSGRLPFDGDNPMGVLFKVVHEAQTPLPQLVPDVPPHVASAIEKALSKKKDDRFPRMVDFVRAILGQQQAVPSRYQLSPLSAMAALPAQSPVAPKPAQERHLPVAMPSVGQIATGPAVSPAPLALQPGANPGFAPKTVMQPTPQPSSAAMTAVYIPSAKPSTGNTPTNIVLNEEEMKALLNRSSATPIVDGEEVDTFDQGPTGVVGSVVGSNDPTPPVPEPGLRTPNPDRPFDPYPSTLSRATGQQAVSSGSTLEPSSLGKTRHVEILFSILGVEPRSTVRLGLCGATAVLLAALLIWLLSGSGEDAHTATGRPTTAEDKLAVDAGTAATESSDGKTHLGRPTTGSTTNHAGHSGAPKGPGRNPVSKPPEPPQKRIKIDPGI